MLRQVINALYKVAIILFLLVGVWQIYNKIDTNQFKQYGLYWYCRFMDGIGVGNAEITIGKSNGNKKTLKVRQAVHDYSLLYNRYLVEHLLLASIKKTSWLVLWGSLILGIIFVIYGSKKRGMRVKRGLALASSKKVCKLIKIANLKANYYPYQLAGIDYAPNSEMQHSLVIGASGTGKTVLISDLIEQIYARGDKAIIYDKKGDYIKWFYDSSKDFILNPFDQRSQQWNLLAEIDNIGHIKTLAEAFISDKGNYSGDNIWQEAARIALSSVLEKMICTDMTMTNQELVELLLKQDMQGVSQLLKNTHAQAIVDLNSPKTAASVMFVLSAHLRSLRLTYGRREESFAIRRWLAEHDRDSRLFISAPEDISSELKPLQTAWFEIVINSLLSGDGEAKEKTWVILDELPTLQKIPSLGRGLAVARSYGGCFVLSMQNIAQLRETYGRNLAEDISSECNTRCIFKANDPDTARWLTQNIGDIEVEEYKEGISYGASSMRDGISVNKQERIKPLLLPSEIQNMQKLHLILKMSDYPAIKTKVRIKKRKIKEAGFISNELLLANMKAMYNQEKTENADSRRKTVKLPSEKSSLQTIDMFAKQVAIETNSTFKQQKKNKRHRKIIYPGVLK
jgi:type IV conjugative transfer system coupling protein TraD